MFLPLFLLKQNISPRNWKHPESSPITLLRASALPFELNLKSPYPPTFIENKYKRENTLKVSGRKLCELLSINPNPLIDNEDLLSGKLTGLKKPKKDDYSTFAETPEELIN